MALRNHLLGMALVALAGREEDVGSVLDYSGLYHPVPCNWKSHQDFSRLKSGNLVPHIRDRLRSLALTAVHAPPVSHVLAQTLLHVRSSRETGGAQCWCLSCLESNALGLQ